MNAFRQLLKAAGGHPPVGTWIMSASPLLAEATGHAGFDWGVIDMEHAPLDLMEVVQLLQAVAATKMVPIVRPVWAEIGEVNQLGRPFPPLGYSEEDARALTLREWAPRTVAGVRDLLSVALQYGNAFLRGFERRLTRDEGLPVRGWYTHQIYAPGLYTGYGVKTLPAIREAIEQRRWDEANAQIRQVAALLDAARVAVEAMTAKLAAAGV